MKAMNKLIILLFFLVFLVNVFAQSFEVLHVDVFNANVGEKATIRIACTQPNNVSISIKELDCTTNCDDSFQYSNVNCDSEYNMPQSFNVAGLHELTVSFNDYKKKAYFNVMPAKNYTASATVQEIPLIFVFLIILVIMFVVKKNSLRKTT